MSYVTLQEGSKLTGKSEMTIRRLTKKPGGKINTKTEDGRILISTEFLYKHYPPIQPIQESIQEPIQAPQEPIQTQSQPDNTTAVDSAMQALISQLEAKDMQIASLMERLKESNINTNRLLQQSNSGQEEKPPFANSQSAQTGNSKSANLWGNPITVAVLVGIVVALLIVVGWMIYQQSTKPVEPVRTGQSRESGYNRDYVKQQNEETDTTEAAPVSMPGAIEE